MGDLRGKALWPYLIVCIVWGSTFIGIRVGVEHLPSFLFAGVRFLIAGAILAVAARLWVAPARQAQARARTAAA